MTGRGLARRSRPWHQYSIEIAIWVILLLLCAQGLSSILTHRDSFSLAIQVLGSADCLLTTAWFLYLQTRALTRPVTRRLLIATAVVVVLSTLNVPLSETWSTVGIAAASVMLVAPRRLALPVGLGVWAVNVAIIETHDDDLATQIALPLLTLGVTVVLYALARLAGTLHDAVVTREELARLQVDEERNRISRDLHDIIGRTLVAASLRNQTALALLDRDPVRAREQLKQLEETISLGQAQLRGLTSGPVVADLADELNSAEALCTRLGIRCEVDAVPVLDPDASRLAGVVLREAITNTLKHSRARTCWIAVTDQASELLVSITNDGAVVPARTDQGDGDPSDGTGTGLRDLASRVADAGGRLTAGLEPPDRFRVAARLPHGAGLVPEEGVPPVQVRDPDAPSARPTTMPAGRSER